MTDRETTDEALARALLTISEVEGCVAKIERYLETNGRHLDLNARVPMERQTEAMRAALDKWRTTTADPERAALAEGNDT